jgi:hypothetical protein
MGLQQRGTKGRKGLRSRLQERDWLATQWALYVGSDARPALLGRHPRRDWKRRLVLLIAADLREQKQNEESHTLVLARTIWGPALRSS